MNQLISAFAAAVLIGAALLTIYSLILRGRLPRLSLKTWLVLAVCFLLTITPKR